MFWWGKLTWKNDHFQSVEKITTLLLECFRRKSSCYSLLNLFLPLIQGVLKMNFLTANRNSLPRVASIVAPIIYGTLVKLKALLFSLLRRSKINLHQENRSYFTIKRIMFKPNVIKNGMRRTTKRFSDINVIIAKRVWENRYTLKVIPRIFQLTAWMWISYTTLVLADNFLNWIHILPTFFPSERVLHSFYALYISHYMERICRRTKPVSWMQHKVHFILRACFAYSTYFRIDYHWQN